METFWIVKLINIHDPSLTAAQSDESIIFSKLNQLLGFDSTFPNEIWGSLVNNLMLHKLEY